MTDNHQFMTRSATVNETVLISLYFQLYIQYLSSYHETVQRARSGVASHLSTTQ